MNIEVNKVKIVVFTPRKYTDALREAACNLGAGIIGNYSYCSSFTPSVGTFIPGDDTNPFIGKRGKLEIVDEVRLEFICDIKNAKRVVCEIRKVHPYEEPGIDIIPLIDENSLI